MVALNFLKNISRKTKEIKLIEKNNCAVLNIFSTKIVKVPTKINFKRHKFYLKYLYIPYVIKNSFPLISLLEFDQELF